MEYLSTPLKSLLNKSKFSIIRNIFVLSMLFISLILAMSFNKIIILFIGVFISLLFYCLITKNFNLSLKFLMGKSYINSILPKIDNIICFEYLCYIDKKEGKDLDDLLSFLIVKNKIKNIENIKELVELEKTKLGKKNEFNKVILKQMMLLKKEKKIKDSEIDVLYNFAIEYKTKNKKESITTE